MESKILGTRVAFDREDAMESVENKILKTLNIIEWR